MRPLQPLALISGPHAKLLAESVAAYTNGRAVDARQTRCPDETATLAADAACWDRSLNCDPDESDPVIVYISEPIGDPELPPYCRHVRTQAGCDISALAAGLAQELSL
ncbi:hypothetical protein [Deinococcus marmoris]|uniref:Uncharacterized protein n=1 Tax=Deinococcus marmoris TaxID=249408 RepID=A0A1U7P327_9DEIO|nr:hypothetical protein [Deinococcus marmoris]OLV19558.1 hypothetical protein BOO71_0002413 [Deinococcus marmoris]